MSDTSDPREETEEAEIALEYELDAAPEKVWRAIAVAAFRERWLPEADLAEPSPSPPFRASKSATGCATTALRFRTALSSSGSSLEMRAGRCSGSSIASRATARREAPTTIFAP